MKKITKALTIPLKVKAAAQARDSIDGYACCLWCGKPNSPSNAHYIPRSHLGLGIEENILTLCEGPGGCHGMYDHSSRREEMQAYFREYLQKHYSGWDESKLVYKK